MDLPLKNPALDGHVPPVDGSASTTPVPRTGAKISTNHDIAVVQADYLALANDLEQAQALATALEMQLSGKTNELAQFKLIWERTQADLAKFDHDLTTMRKERHALANELQTAYAYQHKFERLKIVNEDLQARADRLEAELIAEQTSHAQTLQELELERANPSIMSVNPLAPDLREGLESLRDQLDRVLDQPTRKTPAIPPRSLPRPAQQDHIDIEFGT
jgi:chromosome segregation ATPase